MQRLSSFRERYELPPVRGYTFLGTEASYDKPIVEPGGAVGGWFEPLSCVSWVAQAVAADAFTVALVDGYLPALKYVYRDPASRRTCEYVTFAVDRGALGAVSVYARLVENRGGASPRVRCFRTRHALTIPPEEFDRNLRELRSRWRRFFNSCTVPATDDRDLLNACKASIIRALVTFTGKHPHYGVRAYGERSHDGFPPTILALTHCLIDWGQVPLARDYLLYYFERFVTDGGRFDYYGPALSEYGQMLSLVRRLADADPEHGWLDHLRPKLEAMRKWLWAEQSKSPLGLLAGVPEADTRDEVDVYFHNNAWCWRGLRDTLRVLPRPGDRERCAAYRRAILRAVAEVTDRCVSPPFMPPVARPLQPFASMTQDRFARYTNYRYWLELLSSSILSKSQMLAIINYRITHDGEVAGMTRFSDRADNWPIAHYAEGLLRLGRIEDIERVLLSHLAGHMTPETWTAYEQVSLGGFPRRELRADYCVPAQLVAPRLLAWLARVPG